MSDSIERIIADLRRWGVDGAEEIADRLAALPAVAAPEGWRELLRQSRENFVKQRGKDPNADWVYDDIAELLAAAPSPQATGAVVASDKQRDELREAVRSVLASMYAASPSQLDEYNIHVEGWIETLQRALDTSAKGAS